MGVVIMSLLLLSRMQSVMDTGDTNFFLASKTFQYFISTSLNELRHSSIIKKLTLRPLLSLILLLLVLLLLPGLLPTPVIVALSATEGKHESGRDLSHSVQSIRRMEKANIQAAMAMVDEENSSEAGSRKH